MDVIDKATDASVLMKLLCKTIGVSTKCTHIQFVEGYGALQQDARTYELEIRDMFKEGIIKEMELSPSENGING